MSSRLISITLAAVVGVLASACGSQGPAVGPGLTVTIVADNLDIPWALTVVPDGRLFFTERNTGRVRVVVGGVLLPTPVIALPVCCASGEGGALGLVADPHFASNGFLYVYYTHTEFGGPANRIERLLVSGNTAVRDRVLFDNIPGSLNRHNGGRLKIGPDGMLYATNGDADNTTLPQNPGSLAGKIIRLTTAGERPPDNPFPGSFVYTLGHRNPQGLAWDTSGTLYATEHGATRNDEVNRMLPGRNYGWPLHEGPAHPPPYESPIFVFQTETCAPSGAAFVTGPMIPEWRGDLLFTCLRGAHLHRLRLAGPGSGEVLQSEALYRDLYGRLRDVTMGLDGAVYVSTSNTGLVNRILRIGR